ncbi:MAG: DNA-binding response regulator [Bacteroidetes bacterium]|nr:DNA-binding response regulator [Bacteroidota bacterium]
MKHKILLVEDDVNLAFVVKDTLINKDYDVCHMPDGNGALKAISAHKYDIVLLDVMLPGMDGFSVSKQIRQQRNQTPILFLTAKNMQEDRIRGFEAGGDDYLTKPFSIEELTLRIKAILKRTTKQDDMPITFTLGNYFFDNNTFTLRYKSENTVVTKKEADLLTYLYLNRNKTVTREEILIALWGENDYFKGRSMDVFITRLRKYFHHDTSVNIVNIHGVGFRLEAD